ncbi:facilitated trehalose transporter Tret1-2 homolog [Melanaphis sacchari]|uniref:Facilitated trehalose transporter Tret1-2 n=1 Tax=Melanaphis sacchari TaxID=742174 RepID=A0A2H8TPE5_9HEMI|nr:facilitated trehalose transporter Tret1-2 homolog [Melanaphis sacchari]
MEEESMKLNEKKIHVLETEEVQNENKKTFNWAEFLACVSVSTTNLHTGFALGFSAILIPQLEINTDDIGKLSKSQCSWIASSISIAAPFGCLFIALALDRFGRIFTFKFSLWPCFIGWMLIALAFDPSIIIIGRLLTGFAMSTGTNSANVYMAEICSPKLRGSMMSIGSVMLSFGILLTYCTGLYLHWRTVAWIAFVGAFFPVLMTSFWTPESPVWLIYKGQDVKALKSLKYFKNSKYSVGVQESFNELKTIKEKKDLLINKDIENCNIFRRISWHLFKPTVFKPALFMIFLFVLQQFTGIYTFQFHAVKMLQEVAQGIDIKYATLLFGLFRFLLSFVATGVLHNYGRRPLCMISGIIMGISLFISGLCFYSRTKGDESIIITWVSLLCMLLYISAGSVGIMLIPWILPSEMFPTEVKGLLVGPIMAWCNAVMFVAVHFYEDLKGILGGMLGILWFYSFISILTAFFVWLFIPETHKMKLSEIEDYFKDNTIYLLKKKKTVKDQQL